VESFVGFHSPGLTSAAAATEKDRVKLRTTSILLPLCALLALAALVSFASVASAKPTPQTSLLYVQQTDGGNLRHLAGGGFRLELTGVSPRVSTFTDRPRRRAGSRSLRQFVAGWGKAGFAADPPNAALVLDGAPRSRDVAMLTLSRPRYDRRRHTLSYRVKPLREKDTDTLAGFAKRGDPVRAGDFGSASLFVDNGAAQVGYAGITVEISNAPAGQTFQLLVTPVGGRAGWTIPSSSRGFGALQLVSPSRSPIPVSRLYNSSSAIVLETSAEGTGPTYSAQLNATLEAEGSDTVALTAEGAFGATVILTWPTATGAESQVMAPGDPLTITPVLSN
jgi:hypothetical protein